MTVFTAAALAAMIASPSCGGVSKADLAEHLKAAVLEESHGDQYAIGINADVRRGLLADKTTANTAGEAMAKAAALLAQGRHIDVGLSQISDRQLERHHLTLATVFDECTNLRAGAEHLKDDHDWVLAHRRYNCGATDCGVAYAQRVIARIGIEETTAAEEAPPQEQTPCYVPSWDTWGRELCASGVRIKPETNSGESKHEGNQ